MIHQLNNPNISTHDREIIHAILVTFSPQGSVGNLPTENNVLPSAMANNVSVALAFDPHLLTARGLKAWGQLINFQLNNFSSLHMPILSRRL